MIAAVGVMIFELHTIMEEFLLSNLIQCKACHKEIAKGVKKCPSCGKDQRNWFMRHKFISFIGIIVLFIIIGGALGDGDDTEKASSATDSKETQKEETIYELNDIITIKNMEVAVEVFEELEVIGDPSFLGKEPADGGTLVAIQYRMKNISDKPIGMFSYPSINLIDGEGTKYSSDIEGTSAYAVETKVDNSKVLSDLNPDISVTGVEVYEVSKERFAEGEWFIQIGKEKVKIK